VEAWNQKVELCTVVRYCLCKAVVL